IRAKGPEGEGEIILCASEGEMRVKLPVRDGVLSTVTLSRENEEKVFFALSGVVRDSSTSVGMTFWGMPSDVVVSL
ncbi:MAG: hypothetical protein J5841_08970, partial [Clostridia bacterium]|nr:hypothetical protein [Clostridia bacterium]